MNLLIDYFNEFLELFSVSDEMSIYIIAAYTAVFAVYLLISAFLSCGYKKQYRLFNKYKKSVNNIDELKDLKPRLLNTAASDYIRAAEKGIKNINTAKLIDLSIRRLTYFSANLCRIERALNNFDLFMLAAGILFWLTFDKHPIWLAITAIFFILSRIAFMLFNYKHQREILADALIEYIEAEIGQFYTENLSYSVNLFKQEMKLALNSQMNSIKDALIALGEGVAKTAVSSGEVLNKSITEALRRLTGVNDYMSSIFTEWYNVVNETQSAQKSLNTNINALSLTAERIKTEINETIADIKKLQTDDRQIREASANHIAALCRAAEELNEYNRQSEQTLNTAAAQNELIKKNQAMLIELSQKIELTFENLSVKMGDAIAGIIELQMKSAYNALSDNLSNDIEKITGANSQLALQLNDMFKELTAQSKNEANAIIKLYDKIDSL